MNRILLQIWEVSDRNSEPCRDGCSLHLDEARHNEFVSASYSGRDFPAPAEYNRIVGTYLEAYVEDNLYSVVVERGSVRIPETSLTNLMNLGEIIIKH